MFFSQIMFECIKIVTRLECVWRNFVPEHRTSVRQSKLTGFRPPSFNGLFSVISNYKQE